MVISCLWSWLRGFFRFTFFADRVRLSFYLLFSAPSFVFANMVLIRQIALSTITPYWNFLSLPMAFLLIRLAFRNVIQDWRLFPVWFWLFLLYIGPHPEVCEGVFFFGSFWPIWYCSTGKQAVFWSR
jgi:hypothetical protein